MTRNGKALLALFILGAGSFAAFAANDTIGVTAGTGKIANLIKFVSNNVMSEIGICDATTENQCAAVKAASTAPIATDPALVVALSPNSAGLTTPGQKTSANSQSVVQASDAGPTAVTQSTSPWVTGTGAGDPCQNNAATFTPISITTGTTTKIVTGTAAKKLYICYLYLQTVNANNIAIISGTTGGTCGANTAGLIGGTTSTNGLNNPANGGQAIGNGGYAVAGVATNNDDICLITSASTPLAGVIKTVVQ